MMIFFKRRGMLFKIPEGCHSGW